MAQTKFKSGMSVRFVDTVSTKDGELDHSERLIELKKVFGGGTFSVVSVQSAADFCTGMAIPGARCHLSRRTGRHYYSIYKCRIAEEMWGENPQILTIRTKKGRVVLSAVYFAHVK